MTPITPPGLVENVRDGRGVLRVTLRRPETRNALSPAMVEQLTDYLLHADADKHVRVIVLSGDGPAFCAGGDIDSLRRIAGASYEDTEADARQFASLYALVANLSVPVVARVQGAALGGGTALAACADVVVAADDASFGCTEVRVGLIPAVVAPYLRRRLQPAVARRLLLTGERISAIRAHQIGLADEVVPLAELDAAVEHAVHTILSANGDAQRAIKPLLGTLLGENVRTVTDLSVEASAQFRTSPASREALSDFLATLGSGRP